MTNKVKLFLGGIAIAATVGASPAAAASITCPNIAATPDRQMTLGDATACYYGNGANPSAALVKSTLGTAEAWTNEGELAGSNGTNDLFTVQVTSGSWGSIPASGTWAIDSSFWNTYGRAVISAHVGQGGGDPDWWMFEILQGATSGTWSLVKLSGQGGGFSNMKLWGTGDPECQQDCGGDEVPEPTMLALFGLGLLGAGAARRRAKK